MRKNMKNVIRAFNARRAHREATCSTDGETILSYSTPIARRMPDGSTWVMPYADSPSRTTSSQIHSCLVGVEGVVRGTF
jgi:hypothetical protein